MNPGHLILLAVILLILGLLSGIGPDKPNPKKELSTAQVNFFRAIIIVFRTFGGG